MCVANLATYARRSMFRLRMQRLVSLLAALREQRAPGCGEVSLSDLIEGLEAVARLKQI